MKVMKAIVFASLFGIILLLAGRVHAEGETTGINCAFAWDAPTGAIPVDGYRVYVGTTAATKTRRTQVAGRSVSCSALNLTAGQNYIHVTAYNVAGESGASTTLPFVLVTSVPGVPTNIRKETPVP